MIQYFLQFIEPFQVRIKDCRKPNPQNSFTNTKCLIKHQNKKFFITIQNNITWVVLSMRVGEANFMNIKFKSNQGKKLGHIFIETTDG